MEMREVEDHSSRRAFLRKALLAGGVAAATPLVTSFNSAAGAAVVVGSSTVYSFQYAVSGNGGSCSPATTSTSAASGCQPVGFATGEVTATNATSVGLQSPSCGTYTLPANSTCTFGPGTLATRSSQQTTTCTSTVQPTNGGKTLTFSGLSNNQTIRFTVTC